MEEIIQGTKELARMLDELLKEQSRFQWDPFYADRERQVPFFVNCPDENVVSYFEKGLFKPGNVLELGCGPGRNAVYFAGKGCVVDAVDLSPEALEWGRERAQDKGVDVRFLQKNIFELEIEEGSYEIVYDSGCFHHIAPHRRMDYLQLVKKALKPNGFFALNCFVEDGEFGGASISDWDVYRNWSLMGGLGFTEEKLRYIFKDFEEIEMRRMKPIQQPAEVFGVEGLWTALFQV